MFSVKSNSDRDTINYGKIFSKILKPGDVVVLEGDLGGGKTTFVKGVLKGIGYKGLVLSPTFTLIRQYELKKIFVYHFDLYRIESDDLFDLGAQDLLYSKWGISLIEWGKKIKDELDKYIQVEFKFCNESKRRLVFSVKGYSRERIESIKKAFKKELEHV